ncbi:MAG: diguanylate cyclase [Desulfobacterales bacterium]|nr:diguanylate cyclase [Desulfobacterales bacterium]
MDGLTQIPNRRHFNACLEQEWRRLQRERQPLALILGAIDFFKNDNDYYGHQLGDDCLCSVAQAIEVSIRRPADLAARYGGEEFAVILPNTPLEGGLHVAESMRRAVSELRIDHSRSAVATHVTMSIGMSAVVPDQGGSIERLLQTTDSALYLAKSEGRNCVRSRPMLSLPSP